MKISAKKVGEELGATVFIEPTGKNLCRKFGINKEAANSLNTIEFLKAIYLKFKEKGYEIPKIYVSEGQIPRKNNLAGLQMGNWNIFGPAKLEVSSPEIVIHECGHFLHKKNIPYNQPLYSLFCFIKNIFTPFLNKKEKNIYNNDIKRAYEGGFFRNLELENCLKKGYINEKTLKIFNKSPEKLLSKNAFSNASEFVAEYFTLASQGFKFSPEITRKYESFYGPEIKEIITRDEIDELMTLKKSLEKRVNIKL